MAKKNTYSKRFGMSYKLMMRLVEMVENGSIKKDHPLIRNFDEMKRELNRTKNG